MIKESIMCCKCGGLIEIQKETEEDICYKCRGMTDVRKDWGKYDE